MWCNNCTENWLGRELPSSSLMFAFSRQQNCTFLWSKMCASWFITRVQYTGMGHARRQRGKDMQPISHTLCAVPTPVFHLGGIEPPTGKAFWLTSTLRDGEKGYSHCTHRKRGSRQFCSYWKIQEHRFSSHHVSVQCLGQWGPDPRLGPLVAIANWITDNHQVKLFKADVRVVWFVGVQPALQGFSPRDFLALRVLGA